MKNTLLISLLLFSSSVFAYGDSFVLYCQNGQSVALDYHEAKVLRGRNVDWTGSGSTAQDKFEFLVGKVGEKFPETSAKFKKWQRDFANESLFIADVDLQSVGVPLDLPIPNGCQVKTLITQREKQFDEDRTYLVNKNLWDKLSPEAQAGALMNAFMSREAGEINQYGSRFMSARDVRKWNAFFATDEYEQMTTVAKWAEVLKQTYFDYWLDGLYSPARSEFYADGSIEKTYVNSSRQYKARVQGRMIEVVGYETHLREKWGYLYFTPQGQLYKFSPAKDEEFSVGGLKYSGINGLEIYPNGNIKQMEFKAFRRVKFGKFDGSVMVILFDASGKIIGVDGIKRS